MRYRWLSRALVVLGVALIATGPAPAGANARGDTTSVDANTLPLTANDAVNAADDAANPARPADAVGAAPGSASVCRLAGGPYRDQDVWAFATAAGARLVSLSAAFVDHEGERQIWQLAPADQAIDYAGHSVAWLRTPAGWTLTAATAETTNALPDDRLLVVGACPAGAVPVLGLGQPRDAAVRQAEAPAPQQQAATLPSTGQDVGGMLAAGTGLVIGGVLLLSVRRRRPAPVEPAPRGEDEVHVWTYPTR